MSSTTTSESEEGMLSKDQADSPSFDEVEGSCGGFAGGVTLKKGPWTSAEDSILVEYVKKHGEGNWNAVQKHSGLFRCGKSCRLRWANHLRPNLKKGAFTSEEEHLIIELHAKMGNKWARMAAHLPGRTDNEIKNYWNTRIKRRQRAGLPLYPPDLCMQALHENRRGRNLNEYNSGDAHHIMEGNNFEIPEVRFDHFKGNPGVLSYAPPLPDFSIGSMLHQGFSPSQSCNFFSATTMHCPKRFRGSDLLPGPTQGGQHQNDSFGKQNQHFGLSFPYDPDPNGKNSSTFDMLNGSHANVINGNFSTSKPVLGSLKLELPSLQYPEPDLGTWGTSSSPQPPSLDSVEAFIRSPSPTRSSQLDCDGVSPRNSGLLDALLHESQTLGIAKNQSSEKSSSSCVVTPGIMDSPSLNLCEQEWEDYGDPISPLGRSAASVFSDHTPLSGASPVLSAGSEIKQEPVDNTPDSVRQPPSTRLNFLRPDALLEGSWFGHSPTESCKEHSILISSLIGDDICDYKQMAGNTVGSYSWNDLPPVYQMSEFP